MVVLNEHRIPLKIMTALEQVTDPEIPVLSIMDLGVIHRVQVEADQVYIDLMPTYSGCPAMDVMTADIKKALSKLNYEAQVNLVLSPAWTTDFITAKGRKALAAYGIAPPLEPNADKGALLHGDRIVTCTLCASTNTRMISQFGSTACKALFQCEDCLEPFDYFKCLT